MRYLPTAITAADINIAKGPYFGGEWAVYITRTPDVLLGEIEMTGVGTFVYTDNAATTLSAAADLQLACLTALRSTAACVVTFDTLDNTGTPVQMDATATFAPPARVQDQTFGFERGYAVDLIPEVPGKMYTAITSVTSVTFGAANVKFGLYRLPVQADYGFIGCTTDIRFNTKGRTARGIDCGMETDAFVKRGKTKPGELSIGSKLKGFAEGLMRYDGDKCTVMLVGVKDGVVTGDRIVFTEYTPSVSNEMPDGDGEAMANSEGKYVECLIFVAP